MKITWLGQAGLLFQGDGITLMVDPYLSDSVAKTPSKKHRNVPVDPSFFDVEPDVILFTHDHLDHYDPETAAVFLGKTNKSITVLSPFSVWEKVRAFGNGHNYVMLREGVEWTEGGLRVTAVPACHSDPYAIGAVICDPADQSSYYVTGDTLFFRDVAQKLPCVPDAIFLPVNGAGNNMNVTDASRFAQLTGAKFAVPMHFGLLDNMDPEAFCHSGRVIPEIYQTIELKEE